MKLHHHNNNIKNEEIKKHSQKIDFFSSKQNVAMFIISLMIVCALITWGISHYILYSSSTTNPNSETPTSKPADTQSCPRPVPGNQNGKYLRIANGSENTFLTIPNTYQWLDTYTNGFTFSYWLRLPEAIFNAVDPIIVNLFSRNNPELVYTATLSLFTANPLSPGTTAIGTFMFETDDPNIKYTATNQLVINIRNFNQITFAVSTTTINDITTVHNFTGWVNGTKFTTNQIVNTIEQDLLAVTAVPGAIPFKRNTSVALRLQSDAFQPVMDVKNLSCFSDVLTTGQVGLLYLEPNTNTYALSLVSIITSSFLLGKGDVPNSTIYNEFFPGCINGNQVGNITIMTN